jgi:hypothetical protein
MKTLKQMMIPLLLSLVFILTTATAGRKRKRADPKVYGSVTGFWKNERKNTISAASAGGRHCHYS